ncbi:MAG: M15 family metallopeptidase [Nocardioidaceae bacterium]
MTVRTKVLAAFLAALALAGCAPGSGLDRGATETSAHAPSTDPRPTPPSSGPSTGPSPAPSARPSATRPPEPPRAEARILPLPSRQWRRMVAVGMWRPGCPATRDVLRRVEVNHWDFQGKVRRGVLVVNRDVAPSIARIFTRLFERRFPIRKMVPTEHYRGDSDASLRDDNTSAYNCRRPEQINAPPTRSPHANGRAIDINPRENPWRDPRCRCWSPTGRYHARVEAPGRIVKGGLVWRAFVREGWIWQDIDVPDYMHFDTGYPTEPVHG